MVSRVEKTLGEVTPASGGGKVTFEQAVNGELNPTIKLGDQLITWNSATKKIATDGEWTYDIKPGAGPFDNAAIGRQNAKNQSEFWHRNNTKGEETMLQADGTKRTERWFSSGSLAGKPRTIVHSVNNSLVQFAKYSYDEWGNMIRYQDNVFDCVVDPDANIITIEKKGVTIREDTLGKPVSVTRSDNGKTLIVMLVNKFGRTRQIFVPSVEDSVYDKLITFTKTTK